MTAEQKIILIIDPAIQTPATNAINCINSIVQDLSPHTEFSLGEVVYCAPFLSKVSLYNVLQNKEIGAVISLGSHANVTEKHAFVDELSQYLQQTILTNKIPFFGICFSHQLLAHMYGLEVNFLKQAHTVLGRRHSEFRSIEISHPKISLLATKMSASDYFAHNALDLNFRECLLVTTEWSKRQWKVLTNNPDWHLTPQERRIKNHLDQDTFKTVIAHASHCQEVIQEPSMEHEVLLGATSSLCQIEAIVHSENPIYTFQTHPETPHNLKGGHLLIKNFLYLSSILNSTRG